MPGPSRHSPTTRTEKSVRGFYSRHLRVTAEGSKDAEKDAREILDKVYRYHPDFNPQMMDDGHFMVGYSQPAYSIVFKEELEANRDEEHPCSPNSPILPLSAMIARPRLQSCLLYLQQLAQ